MPLFVVCFLYSGEVKEDSAKETESTLDAGVQRITHVLLIVFLVQVVIHPVQLDLH